MTLGMLGALSAGMVAGADPAPVPPTTAATFTWTGTDAGAGTNTNWSDGGNWQGGVAPTSSTSVKLVFPVLTCATTSCGQSHNDLTGLRAVSLHVQLAQSATSPVPDQYSISGNGIRVAGLSVGTAAHVAGDSGALAGINVPITLSQSQTWNIKLDNNSQPAFSTITGGPTTTLTISPTGNGFVDLDSAVSVGTLDFVGTSGSFGNGTIAAYGNLNKGGNPVNVTDVGYFSPFTETVGALTTSSSAVQFGNGGGNPPFAIATVKGNAVLDAGSNVSFWSLAPGTATPTKPVAGTDYTQLSATGSAALGSAHLTLFAHCDLPLGALYTIVRAPGGLSGTFAGIANGAILQAAADQTSSCTAPGATAPWLKYQYNANTFTAKVVAPPPGASPRTPAAAPYNVAGAGGTAALAR
jgi:hypothetical protein